MQTYGALHLSPCKTICDKLIMIIEKIRSIPSDFVKKVFNAIKRSESSLLINLKDLKLWPIPSRGIKALHKNINKDPFTRDLFTINEKDGSLIFSNPLFLAYVRWIDKDCSEKS